MNVQMSHFWRRLRSGPDAAYQEDDNESGVLALTATRKKSSLPDAILDGRSLTPASAEKVRHSLLEPTRSLPGAENESFVPLAERMQHSKKEGSIAAQAQLLVDTMAVCFAPSVGDMTVASRYPQPLTPLWGADPC